MLVRVPKRLLRTLLYLLAIALPVAAATAL